MTHLQLTPDDPPPGTPEDPGRDPGMEAPGVEDAPEMRLAEDERLQREEIERAADEGMIESPLEAHEGAIGSAPEEGPSANPGFDEGA
jgi:hypothetical protein